MLSLRPEQSGPNDGHVLADIQDDEIVLSQKLKEFSESCR